jgi:hypothetical protein
VKHSTLSQQRQVRPQLRRLRQSPSGVKVSRRRHSSSHGALLNLDLLPSRQVLRLRLSLSVEQVAIHIHSTSLCSLCLFNKLASPLVPPERSPEPGLNVCLVVCSHYFSDVDRGFAGVIEGDRGDEVVADVGADDVVEEMRIDESEITIDGSSGAASERPRLVIVMRH